MIFIFDDGDINVDDVTVFQFFIAGNAVTHLMVHGSAD